MNFSSLQLYAQMQDEINQLEACCKNETAKVEACFNIILFYRNKIKNCSESYVFKYERDEINFFKYIKPLFISAMEYYMLLYQAVLFKPSDDKDKLISYWIHELQRAESFYIRHRDFYDYYTSGRTDKDHLYFNRHTNSANSQRKDSGKTCSSASPGYIAARILGYQKYYLYVESQLEMLVQDNTKRMFSQQRNVASSGLVPHGADSNKTALSVM